MQKSLILKLLGAVGWLVACMLASDLMWRAFGFGSIYQPTATREKIIITLELPTEVPPAEETATPTPSTVGQCFDNPPSLSFPDTDGIPWKSYTFHTTDVVNRGGETIHSYEYSQTAVEGEGSFIETRADDRLQWQQLSRDGETWVRYSEDGAWETSSPLPEEAGISIEGSRWNMTWFQFLGKGKWCDKGIVEEDGRKLHQWVFTKEGDFPDPDNMTGFTMAHVTKVEAHFFTEPDSNFVVKGEVYTEGYNEEEDGEKILIEKHHTFSVEEYSGSIPDAPSSP